MKQTFKFLTLFLLTLLGTSNLWADPTWMGNSYIVVNNAWYNGSGSGNKTPGDIGAITSLTLTGQIQTYGDNNGSSHPVTMYYKFDDESSQSISLTWQKYANNNNHFGYVDNKGVTPQTIDLSGLAAGSHTLAIWFNSSAGNLWDSNDGKNYNFSFTYNKTLSITYKDKGGSDFSGSHEANYPTTHTYGTATTLKSASKTGYTFGGWFKSSDCSGTAVTSLGKTEYTSDITLYAKWTANTHKLAWVTDGDALTGDYTHGDAIAYGTTIVAPDTPTKTGYTFAGWNNGSSVVTPAATMPDNDLTYTATWTEKTHNITISNDGNGSTDPTGEQTNVGEVTGIEITATPNDGYGFKEWVVSGGTVSGQSVTTTFKPTADNATIQATFQSTAVYYTWGYGVYQSTGGTVESTVAAGDHVQGGTSITLTAHPATGYEVEGWYNNADCTGDKLQTGGDTYTFSISSNSVRYVKFKKTDFAITYTTQSTGWTYGNDNPTTANYQDEVSFVVTPTAGYTVSVTSSDATLDATGAPTYTFTMPAKDVAISVNASENMTTVTVNANQTSWGTVSGAVSSWGSTTTAGVATSRTLTAAAKPGYKFVTWELANCVLVTGSLTNAQITIKGDGSSATGTAVATFAEDLTANWYIEGEKALLTKCTSDWQQKNANYRFSKPSKDASSAYIDIEITQAQVEAGKEYQFKLRDAGVGGEPMYGWGTNGDDHHTFIATETFEIYNTNGSDHNLRIKPSIAGTYRFSIDWSENKKRLTVTWPSVNDLHHNFTGEWTHTAGTVENGVLTANYEITQAMVDSKSDLEFEIIYEGVYYGPGTDKAQMTATNHTDWKLEALGHGYHVVLKPSIAGTYTFVFDSKAADKNFNVTYPVPDAPASITVTAERYFGEDKINTFIETSPAYKVYTDETIKLTIDAVAAPTGCTTYYQFGTNEASAERTFTIENPTTAADQSIEAKVFFRPNAGGEDGEAKSETIAYQGVAKPSLNLTTSWSTHNDEAQEGVDVPENVTVHYSAGNYSGPATVTRSKDGGDPVNFFIVESGDQKSETYALLDKSVQRQTFVATAEVNGRTFTATKAISIYRLVEITITDANNLMNHYYMWEDGTNPTRKEAEWPGNSFFSTLGNAHIFYVKYPSYTHFVLNNGRQAGEEGAIQTVNIELPDQSACYTIGEKITTEGDNYNKYNVQVAAQCPNKLYVGDIDDVSAVQGEGVIVSPQVDIDPLLDANNLVISFNYGSVQGITCDQRGRSFMVTATAGTGTYNIQVTYSIPGAESVTKPVTINVTSAIMIQAKYGNLAWSDHNEIYIHYWGIDINATQKMTWKDYVGADPNKQDRVSARIPLGSDDKINFQIYAWNMDENWHVTKDVNGVTESGCYTITPDPDCDNGCKRNITYDGDNCWTAYYVEIDMNNGTVYRSNTVEDLSQTVSFFAPGASEETAKAGLVRIICNGSQTATIDASKFTTSGVYTATITEGGAGLSAVAPYTGDYYIRTDGVEGGWSDYKKASHKFTNFSLYNGAKYNYYWVANVKKVNNSQTFNIKGCVGNEYNENLANMIESDNYTDGTGNITVDEYGVNLRFGYNPQTNHFERAILRGAGNNYFLNIQGDNIYNDEDCNDQVLNETNYNSHPEYSKFNDVSDWVYEKLIFVQIDNEHQSSNVLLKSKAFNGQILYQLGYTTDILGRSTLIPAEKVVIGAGSTNGKYTLRVIYDYKTNRLSATWEPSGVISEVKKVDSDILFVSNEGGEVKQITFGGDSATARLESLQSVMYVLEMENGYEPKESAPDAQYWIALPFECKINDIFGIENYITLDENRIAQSGWWGIMRYRGDLRAQKGWFIEDTPDGFWEWMYPTETLMPGEGYILYVEKSSLSWNSITVEEPCEGTEDGCQDGKKSVQKFVKRFYFPSLVEGFTMNKSGEASSKVTYPNQPCNITTPVDRRAEDSNWKVIAPKSYNNVSIHSAEDQKEGYTLGPDFIYTYDAAKDKGSRYTATPTADFEFQAFHGYMAQYGGTITWNPYSKTEHPTSAPYYGEEPSFKGGMLTIELVQNNEQLDRTFVKLSKNGTEGFDQNLDLTKITESCAQIASVSENVVYAGNTLPLNIELVPLNVKVTANGTYDIALEKSLKGLEVNLFDAFEQTTTPLDMMSATVTLNKGEYKDRFYLQLKQKGSDTPTSFDGKLEQYNLPTDKTQKLLINDQIYLINAGRIYNASGTKVK